MMSKKQKRKSEEHPVFSRATASARALHQQANAVRRREARAEYVAAAKATIK
jgi:hypothetical protein